MVDWTETLLSQLAWHWDEQLRPRLDGLTDDEYLWEPASVTWSVRRQSEIRTRRPAGIGEWLMDFEYPEPTPAPVTTIAWRMAHLIVGVFGERNARYFDGPPIDITTFDFAGNAASALAQLDEGQRIWRGGVAGLDSAALAENCREPGFESDSMAALILHIHREVIHHGAEISLLRDLYAQRSPS